MGDDKGFGIAICLAWIFGVCVGVYVAATVADHMWQKQAVECGYAQYAPDTGKWHWMPKPIVVKDAIVVEGPDYQQSARDQWNKGEK